MVHKSDKIIIKKKAWLKYQKNPSPHQKYSHTSELCKALAVSYKARTNLQFGFKKPNQAPSVPSKKSLGKFQGAELSYSPTIEKGYASFPASPIHQETSPKNCSRPAGLSKQKCSLRISLHLIWKEDSYEHPLIVEHSECYLKDMQRKLGEQKLFFSCSLLVVHYLKRCILSRSTQNSMQAYSIGLPPNKVVLGLLSKAVDTHAK